MNAGPALRGDRPGPPTSNDPYHKYTTLCSTVKVEILLFF